MLWGVTEPMQFYCLRFLHITCLGIDIDSISFICSWYCFQVVCKFIGRDSSYPIFNCQSCWNMIFVWLWMVYRVPASRRFMLQLITPYALWHADLFRLHPFGIANNHQWCSNRFPVFWSLHPLAIPGLLQIPRKSRAHLWRQNPADCKISVNSPLSCRTVLISSLPVNKST